MSMKCSTWCFGIFWEKDGVVTSGKVFNRSRYGFVQERMLARWGAYVVDEMAGTEDKVVVSINRCCFTSTNKE